MCQLFKRSHCLTKWTFWMKIYFCKQRWGGRKLIVERHLFDLIKSIRRIPKVHCLHKTTLWVRHGINNKPHIYWFIHFIHSFVLTLKSPIGEVVNLAYMYTYIHTTLLVGVLWQSKERNALWVNFAGQRRNFRSASAWWATQTGGAAACTSCYVGKTGEKWQTERKWGISWQSGKEDLDYLGSLLMRYFDEVSTLYRRIQCLTIKSFNL